MTPTQQALAQTTLAKAAEYFAAEPAAVSCLGDLAPDAKFLTERVPGGVTLKVYIKQEGCAGHGLVATLDSREAL